MTLPLNQETYKELMEDLGYLKRFYSERAEVIARLERVLAINGLDSKIKPAESISFRTEAATIRMLEGNKGEKDS